MKWSATLGRFAGIDVKVHATFLLVLAWVGWSAWRAAGSLGVTFEAIAFVLAIFFCVVLHEFGHALTARRYGVETRDIILLPIGGVARLDRIPDNPRQELWIALAGPAVNVAIAGTVAAWLTLTGTWQSPEALAATGGSFLERLVLVNVVLTLFNLLPAFPMDGGRILRALLGLHMRHVDATRIAARVGQLMAVGFAVLAFFGNPFLLLIAAFVWIGATREAHMARLRHSYSEAPMKTVILTDYRHLNPVRVTAVDLSRPAGPAYRRP